MERDKRTQLVIGAAMEVHRELGPGHLEAVYQEALEIEFDLQEIPYVSKPTVEIGYKGRRLKKHYVPDFLVFGEVVVEIKSQSALGRIDDAQIINSLKCCKKRVGLLVNFGVSSLKWKRLRL
jgi:GxxExxY protein